MCNKAYDKIHLNLKQRVNMQLFFYFISTVAIVITFSIGLKHGLLGLALFATSPYITLVYLLKIAKHHTAILTARVVTLFLISVGLYFLLDTTYMERNLEYKFSFLFIPIWQWTMLLVSGFVIYLSNENKDKKD
jgi:hypothetical protein